MSIEIKNITKIYGDQRAVDDISFSVKKGEIVGFLGPNGAGKTTTMKIITSYIPATSGDAMVCEHNVVEEPEIVRRKIGYLPEHNPLYKDMYVKEYLSFVAGLHKVQNRSAKIKELIDLTGLGREQHKKIGSLSKGFRQRVGLAQAIIHDPEVLILDEPTTGLDPNQLLEIRTLIRNLGKEKTVIFSSHIMQEVQALCDRVLIINKGRLVADDSIDMLTQYQTEESLLVVEFESEVNDQELIEIKGVKRIKAKSGKKYELICDKESDVRKLIFRFAVEKNNVLLGMKMEDYSIEDVFQKLTKN